MPSTSFGPLLLFTGLIESSFPYFFIHFICSTKIKTEALQIENEQDSKANIYALTAAFTFIFPLLGL